MAHGGTPGGGVKGKLANEVGSQDPSHPYTSAASSWLNWCSTDLNGLDHFAKRQNLVSVCVPSHFKCSLPQNVVLHLEAAFEDPNSLFLQLGTLVAVQTLIPTTCWQQRQQRLHQSTAMQFICRYYSLLLKQLCQLFKCDLQDFTPHRKTLSVVHVLRKSECRNVKSLNIPNVKELFKCKCFWQQHLYRHNIIVDTVHCLWFHQTQHTGNWIFYVFRYKES